MKRLLFPLLALSTIFVASCSNNSNKIDTQKISETQKQREVCLNWYGYRIDTKKAINDLNLKIETESELMAYCDFFKNVADTK
jgi:hypothetical protein